MHSRKCDKVAIECVAIVMSGDDAPRPVRPLVLPEPFTGETDYCDWTDHFENVAVVNGWDEAAKLQWLKV